jgi:hypothetical protein
MRNARIRDLVLWERRKNIKLKRSNTGYLLYALVLASQVIKSQNNGNCPVVVLDAIKRATRSV